MATKLLFLSLIFISAILIHGNAKKITTRAHLSEITGILSMMQKMMESKEDAEFSHLIDVAQSACNESCTVEQDDQVCITCVKEQGPSIINPAILAQWAGCITCTLNGLRYMKTCYEEYGVSLDFMTCLNEDLGSSCKDCKICTTISKFNKKLGSFCSKVLDKTCYPITSAKTCESKTYKSKCFWCKLDSNEGECYPIGAKSQCESGCDGKTQSKCTGDCKWCTDDKKCYPKGFKCGCEELTTSKTCAKNKMSMVH